MGAITLFPSPALLLAQEMLYPGPPDPITACSELLGAASLCW